MHINAKFAFFNQTDSDLSHKEIYMPLDLYEKHQKLLALGTKRRNAQVPLDCHPIGKYQAGAYELVYVSPYTKSAKNVDAEVALVLQDWDSDKALRGPLDCDAQILGYTSTMPTNVNLIALLRRHLDLSLAETFATNLFPFIKGGARNNDIPARLMREATEEFGMPQIQVIRPKLVICLGISVFNSFRRFHHKKLVESVGKGIESPFSDGQRWYWCQSHPGQLGFINRESRGRHGQVAADWETMAACYRESFKSLAQ